MYLISGKAEEELMRLDLGLRVNVTVTQKHHPLQTRARANEWIPFYSESKDPRKDLQN